MSTKTTNLGLDKPSYSDPPDIQVINNDMDAIDSAVNQRIEAYIGTDGFLHYKYPLVTEK